jgi:hypothetical protein
MKENKEIELREDEKFNFKICNKSLKYVSKQGLKQLTRHIRSNKHERRKELRELYIDDDLMDAGFNEDIARALVVNNIPSTFYMTLPLKKYLKNMQKGH